MIEPAHLRIEEVLNNFTEVMSALMIDQYQKQIADSDLTLAQAQALRILRRGEVTTGQLGCELRISAPAITQLTDRLVRKGLIERRSAVDDRRCVIVALSTRGRELVDQFRQHRRDIFSSALSHLGEEERRQIVEALVKVVASLEMVESGARRESHLEGPNSKAKKQAV
jgi:MarR family transcriptional regulator, organic hydroperoxide resistance regulator